MQQLEVEADVDSSRVQAGSVAAVFGLVTPQMMLTYRPPLQTFTLLILGPQWTLGEMDLHTLSLLFNFRFLLCQSRRASRSRCFLLVRCETSSHTQVPTKTNSHGQVCFAVWDAAENTKRGSQ